LPATTAPRFTASFPGYERDEWRYADEVARRSGVVEPHAVERAAADAREISISSFSIRRELCSLSGTPVAGDESRSGGRGGRPLTARAADELFAATQSRHGFAIRSGRAQRTLRELAARPGRTGAVGRSLAIDHLPAAAKRAYWRRTASPYAAGGVIEQAAEDGNVTLDRWITSAFPARRQLALRRFATVLPELPPVRDRSSMAWSRELRLPLLGPPDRRRSRFHSD